VFLLTANGYDSAQLNISSNLTARFFPNKIPLSVAGSANNGGGGGGGSWNDLKYK
jgi:hypothetical protein